MIFSRAHFCAILLILHYATCTGLSTAVYTYNSHSYRILLTPLPWLEASREASAAGGYLTTIESSAENAFVASLMKSHVPTLAPGGFYHNLNGSFGWVGASDLADGRFRWSKSTSLVDSGYTAWASTQPDVAARSSSGVGISFTGFPLPTTNTALWAAIPAVLALPAVVEFDTITQNTPATPQVPSAAPASAVPSPATAPADAYYPLLLALQPAFPPGAPAPSTSPNAALQRLLEQHTPALPALLGPLAALEGLPPVLRTPPAFAPVPPTAAPLAAPDALDSAAWSYGPILTFYSTLVPSVLADSSPSGARQALAAAVGVDPSHVVVVEVSPSQPPAESVVRVRFRTPRVTSPAGAAATAPDGATAETLALRAYLEINAAADAAAGGAAQCAFCISRTLGIIGRARIDDMVTTPAGPAGDVAARPNSPVWLAPPSFVPALLATPAVRVPLAQMPSPPLAYSPRSVPLAPTTVWDDASGTVAVVAIAIGAYMVACVIGCVALLVYSRHAARSPLDDFSYPPGMGSKRSVSAQPQAARLGSPSRPYTDADLAASSLRARSLSPHLHAGGAYRGTAPAPVLDGDMGDEADTAYPSEGLHSDPNSAAKYGWGVGGNRGARAALPGDGWRGAPPDGYDPNQLDPRIAAAMKLGIARRWNAADAADPLGGGNGWVDAYQPAGEWAMSDAVDRRHRVGVPGSPGVDGQFGTRARATPPAFDWATGRYHDAGPVATGGLGRIGDIFAPSGPPASPTLPPLRIRDPTSGSVRHLGTGDLAGDMP